MSKQVKGPDKNEIMAKINAWQEKYKDVLIAGLSDGPNYVKVSGKSLDAVELTMGIRPVIARIGYEIMLIGAKISVFPTQKEESIATANADYVIPMWVEQSYPAFEFVKKNRRRAGTVAFTEAKAGLTAGGSFVEIFKNSGHVDRLLNLVEEKLGTKIENRNRVARALTEGYLTILPSAFMVMGTEDKDVALKDIIEFAKPEPTDHVKALN